MAIFNYLTSKKFLFGFIVTILIILSVIGAIYIIDAKKTTTLANYNNLKKSIEQAEKIDKISTNRSFNVALKKISSLESENMTKDEQLNTVKFAWNYLYAAYSETNNPELYKLSLEFKKFAEANFADKNLKLNVQCLDSTCAENAIPKEIETIIKEINKSNISDAIKSDYSQQLKTFTYISDNDSEIKVIDYLSLADSINADEEFTKEGINVKIYNEIRDYVKGAYPELYNKYSSKTFIEKIQ